MYKTDLHYNNFSTINQKLQTTFQSLLSLCVQYSGLGNCRGVTKTVENVVAFLLFNASFWKQLHVLAFSVKINEILERDVHLL